MTKGFGTFVRSTQLRRGALALLAAAAVGSSACTKAQLQGQSSSFLIIEQMTAAKGNEPDNDSSVLDSDVQTNGSVFQDIGRIQMRLGLKDPGTTQNPSIPTSANYITVTRFHVKYIRTDGRNTQGVDVPYEYDGGTTVTVTESGGTAVVTLVRVQAKLESPLKALAGLGGQVAISTIAEVTLYGKDQAGREVTVKGTMNVTFADFADPSGGN